MNQPLPFRDIAANLDLGWSTRCSLLQYVSPGTPSSVSELRMNWYAAFKFVYMEWLRGCSHWSLSETEAEQIVDERVGQHVNDCCAMELDAQHLWSYLRLTENEAAKLFEYPDEKEFSSTNRLEGTDAGV